MNATELIAAGSVSSSSMVPVASLGVPRTAFDDGFDSVSLNVSSSSSTVSSPVAILIVADVSPAVMVRLASLAAAV